MTSAKCKRRRQRQTRCLQVAATAGIVLVFSSRQTKVNSAIVGSFIRPNDPRYRHSITPKDKNAVDENPINDPSVNDVSATSRASSSSYSSDIVAQHVKRSPDGQQAALMHRAQSSPQHSTIDVSEFTYSTSIHRNNEKKATTPCFPENSGYFGATYGTPQLLPYELEIQYINDIDSQSTSLSDGISTVNYLLQRAIVADIFPSICKSVNNNSQVDDYNPKNYSSGRIIGLKFDNALRFDSTEKCLSQVVGKSPCGVYYGKLGLYGRDITYDTLTNVIDGIKASLPTIKGEVAVYGITGLSMEASLVKGNNATPVFTNFRNNSEILAGNLTDRISASLGGKEPISPGAKFGFSLAAISFCAAFAILFLYVRLDLRYRQDRMTSQRARRKRYLGFNQNGNDDNDDDGLLNPVNKTRILGNKPRSSPETWGPVGVLRSYTSRTELTQSTDYGGDAISSSATSTILESSQMSPVVNKSRKSFLVEFAPGLNPPLGRPEEDDMVEDEDTIDDYENNSCVANEKVLHDLEQIEIDDEDSLFASMSIADYSNIDEQIRENDRRNKIKTKSGRWNNHMKNVK